MWLLEGNKNSKYFHVWTTNRRRKNKINTMQDETGRWLKDSQLHSYIIEYFRDMFSTRHKSGYIKSLPPLEGRITIEMKESLSKDFVAEEITLALKQMHPYQALGPEGMSPSFFQKFQDTLDPLFQLQSSRLCTQVSSQETSITHT